MNKYNMGIPHASININIGMLINKYYAIVICNMRMGIGYTILIIQVNKIIQEMEQRQLSKSQDKIQKMESSMVAFRQLIESLRVKNMKTIRQPQSQINPQMQSSNHSRLYASEKIPENKTHTDRNSYTNLFVASASMPVINEDQGLKLKTRGHVAGRDVLNKKSTLVPSSKFDETMSNIKEHARNKNVQTPSSFADEVQPGSHPAVEQIKNILKNNKKNSNNSNSDEHHNFNGNFQTTVKDSMIHKSFAESSNAVLNKTSTTMPLSAPKFQQNRFNLKAIASRNKIKDIDEYIILKYCKQAERLNQHSKADQIFDFFEGLTTQANVAIISPFIKKFKNCIYFGAPILEDQIYEGFLYFYEQKIYYGEFLKNQKHGKGVEVYLQDQAIYKGLFKQGQKTGKFWVKKQDQLYVGFLEKGLYHGQGKLQAKQSVYEGQFENGEKHGFGEQSFKKTGVKMTGYFDRGVFSKRSKSSFSHNQLQRGIKFRSNHKPNINRIIPNSTRNSRNSSDQKSQEMQNGIRFQQEMNFTSSPFSTNNNSFQPRRTLFNKQKINSFLPGMGQKLIDPMPENCKDFDYSFDVSSKRQSQFSYFGAQIAKNRVHQKVRKENYLKIPQISQVSQQQNNHLDTSALQEPLPIPCFYKR